MENASSMENISLLKSILAIFLAKMGGHLEKIQGFLLCLSHHLDNGIQ